MCRAAYNREWRKANPEKTLESYRKASKKYEQANREKRNERMKQWRRDNPEKARANSRQMNAKLAAAWQANPEPFRAARRAAYAANPEPFKAQAAKRKAKLLGVYVEDVPFDDILQRDLGICGICNLPILESTIELDHIIPLAAGGRHERTNVQLSHRTCNRRKWAKANFTLAA